MGDINRLDDAAAAALWSLRNLPKEHIGLLYGDDLARSEILTSGNDGRVKGTFRIPVGALRAIFHNHPSGTRERDRAKFSNDDLAQAMRAKVPSYISAGDRVMRFDPSTGKTEEVLAEFPWEEFKAFLMLRMLERPTEDARGLLRALNNKK